MHLGAVSNHETPKIYSQENQYQTSKTFLNQVVMIKVHWRSSIPADLVEIVEVKGIGLGEVKIALSKVMNYLWQNPISVEMVDD